LPSRVARSRPSSRALLLLITVVTALGLLLPTTAASASGPRFTDTTGIHAQTAIEALAAEGVVQGCGDGQFCPNDRLTRGQLATILVGALDLPPAPDRRFTDVDRNVHADNI
jgi:hypothetical protein